jgi:hypothetical protein
MESLMIGEFRLSCQSVRLETGRYFRRFALGAIGIVMALGIKQVETRLLRWRPEQA